jgi:hypothetical protein
LDQRPEFDAALALGDGAADAGDAVGADSEAEVADPVGVAADAELAAAGDAVVDAVDEELAGAAGRGGGFAAGGGAAAGAGRAGGTVGIASFEIGLLAGEGRAAVRDAVGGGDGRFAAVALVEVADVVCAADVDDWASAGKVPGDAGLEAAANRDADGAVVDGVGEPSWRAPDAVDARAADCARPDEPAALAGWAVALGAPPKDAPVAEPVAAEPAPGALLLALVTAEPGGAVLVLAAEYAEAEWAAAGPIADCPVAAEPVAVEPVAVELVAGGELVLGPAAE